MRADKQSLAAWLHGHYKLLWWCCLLLACTPGAWLGLAFMRGETGINPLETLQSTTGRWTLLLLIATLSITPLRRFLARLSITLHSRYGKRLSDWNWIIRLRRMLGLCCFGYALSHVGIYLHFDLAYDWLWALEDVREKPYIIAGLLAFTLLLPLAATSTNGMMRRLGKKWRPLHRLIYPFAVIALVHFWWIAKAGEYDALPYTLIIGFLLCFRLFWRYGWLFNKPTDDGMEVAERPDR